LNIHPTTTKKDSGGVLVNGKIELPQHERGIAQWIIKHAKGMCVDIGAGIGTHTRVMAQIPKVNLVYAFEPIPYNYCKLASLNLPKVKIMPFALGRNAGIIKLYANKVGKATHFPWVNATAIFSKRAVGHAYKESITVPVMPLNKAILKADFLKIDVEGMEYDVLLGAKGVYDKAWMVVELHGWNNYKIKDLVNLLSKTHQILNKIPPNYAVHHIFLKPKES